MILIIPQIRKLHISGITLFPFIILREKALKQDKRIMNHERIHIRQQVELLVLPFYVVYLIEYAVGLIKYRNKMKAYLNISFEREAYRHDANLDYLKKRQWWAWRIYI
ncbi:MAG: hypothetical protein WCK78_16305 [Paludibacter sp.]